MAVTFPMWFDNCKLISAVWIRGPSKQLLSCATRALNTFGRHVAPRCITQDGPILVFLFNSSSWTFAGQEFTDIPGVRCSQSCRHVQLMRQLAIATILYIVCFIAYCIVNVIYRQRDLELAEVKFQFVLIASMWDAAKWLFVAQLYYGLR